MKKAVLFVGYDTPIETEIGEFVRDKATPVHFAHTTEQAIRFMDEHPVKSVILNLRSLNDAVILRYVNQYYPEVHVVVSANKEFDEVIGIFNQSNYSRLPSPFRLDELGTVL